MKKMTALFCGLSLAIGGCTSEELGERDELGTVEEALSGSPAAPSRAATVYITASKLCTGTVLTDHWILTAAHCVASWTSGAIIGVSKADQNGALVQLYNGTYEAFRHPDWGGTDATGYDLGLVYLTGGSLAGYTPRGNLFSDTAHPWYGSGGILNTVVEGFGDGSAPGAGGCVDGHRCCGATGSFPTAAAAPS